MTEESPEQFCPETTQRCRYFLQEDRFLHKNVKWIFGSEILFLFQLLIFKDLNLPTGQEDKQVVTLSPSKLGGRHWIWHCISQETCRSQANTYTCFPLCPQIQKSRHLSERY